MNAYRCDKCGQFREGRQALTISWGSGIDARMYGTDQLPSSIDLCHDCASEVVAPLIAIAKTETGE